MARARADYAAAMTATEPVEHRHHGHAVAVASALVLAADIVLTVCLPLEGFLVSAVTLLFAVALAYAFAVPRDRFLPEPPPDVVYDGPVCFGTSGDCPGG